LVNWPAGQLEQLLYPIPENAIVGQSVQWIAALTLLYNPAEQFKQFSIEETGACCPGEHFLHIFTPIREENVPGGQGLHSREDLTGAYFPYEHKLQNSSPRRLW
jgi:hypothetical protein